MFCVLIEVVCDGLAFRLHPFGKCLDVLESGDGRMLLKIWVAEQALSFIIPLFTNFLPFGPFLADCPKQAFVGHLPILFLFEPLGRPQLCGQ
jgi:hypothetical protein